MGGEPGDHRDAEPVYVIGELVQLGAMDAGIDQDQSVLHAHDDGIGPDPLALPDPDAVGHLIQLAHFTPIGWLRCGDCGPTPNSSLSAPLRAMAAEAVVTLGGIASHATRHPLTGLRGRLPSRESNSTLRQAATPSDSTIRG
jgi:hypothetical protein